MTRAPSQSSEKSERTDAGSSSTSDTPLNFDQRIEPGIFVPRSLSECSTGGALHLTLGTTEDKWRYPCPISRRCILKLQFGTGRRMELPFLHRARIV